MTFKTQTSSYDVNPWENKPFLFKYSKCIWWFMLPLSGCNASQTHVMKAKFKTTMHAESLKMMTIKTIAEVVIFQHETGQ